ncbi:hypothetical protein D3C71_1440370 [compost metagenome]
MDAFFLDAIRRARVEHLDRIAAQFHRSAGAVVGAVQHLADAGNLLADLHAANADGHRGRAFADAEDMRGKRLAHALGHLGGVRVLALREQGEAVFAEARQLCVVTQRGRQVLAHRGDQGIGRIQADVRQQSCVMVRLDQQEAVLAIAAADLRHRVFQVHHEGRAVEQAGDLVALAQFFDFARQLGVVFLATTEHDLEAGFAFVSGGGEFHRRREGIAVLVAGVGFVLRRRGFALAQ